MVDEKKCPDCAELIKEEAIKCKHCGHEFKARKSKGLIFAISIFCLLLVFFYYWLKYRPSEKMKLAFTL